jgi:phage portal protein BeeE
MLYTEALFSLAGEIARLMGVPAFMISADTNNSMTYQNIVDARREFASYTLAPYYCAIEDRLSMDDITPHGSVVKFNISETFLRTNDMERLSVIEKMLSLNLITVEQARAMEDLSPNGESGVYAHDSKL